MVVKMQIPWPPFLTWIKVSVPEGIGHWEAFEVFWGRKYVLFIVVNRRIVCGIFIDWLDGRMKEFCVKMVWKWLRPEAGTSIAVVEKNCLMHGKCAHYIKCEKRSKYSMTSVWEKNILWIPSWPWFQHWVLLIYHGHKFIFLKFIFFSLSLWASLKASIVYCFWNSIVIFQFGVPNWWVSLCVLNKC